METARLPFGLLCLALCWLAPGEARSGSLARYRVDFEASWSAASHPGAYPPGAHFSGLVGGTHTDAVSLWSPGALASPGIEAMAETGAQNPLSAEVQAQLPDAGVASLIRGGGIASAPGSVSLEFEIHSSHPYATLVSMVAPSPDWFVGVAGEPLFAAGSWLDEVLVSLPVWDAGSDDGVDFTSPDAESAPHVPIALLGAPVAGLPDFGSFRFTLLSVTADPDDDGLVGEDDNCLEQPNGPLAPDAGGFVQLDADADGFGNACDADFNQDFFVGGPDFDAFLQCFDGPSGRPGPAVDPLCAESDLNGDGFVGGPDFDLLLRRFNAAPGPSGQAAGCGLGFELVLALPLLVRLARGGFSAAC